MTTVVIVSPKNRATLLFRADLIHSLVEAGCRVIVTGPNTEDAERITLLGSEFQVVGGDKNGTNPFADSLYLLRLLRLFRRERPDVVMGFTIKPVIYGMVAARLAGVPFRFATIEGVGWTFYPAESIGHRLVSLVSRVLYRTALASAAKVFFLNPDDRELFVSARLATDRQAVLLDGIGVNLEHYSFRRPEKFDRPIRFLVIARLIRAKGIADYIESASILKDQGVEADFWLVGATDPSSTSFSVEDVEAWVAAGLITYFGTLEDVREIIANSDVLVLPSYREGLPRSVMEALSIGRAIVTTDVPGCRETVRNIELKDGRLQGSNGLLVSPQDPAGLASAMASLVSQPEVLIAMGVDSRRYAEERFSSVRVNARIVKVLQDAGVHFSNRPGPQIELEPGARARAQEDAS